MMLLDTGATLHDYNSDITRSYVFGEADARQREIWELDQAIITGVRNSVRAADFENVAGMLKPVLAADQVALDRDGLAGGPSLTARGHKSG